MSRLVQIIPTLLIVSLLVFLIIRLIPGDPAVLLAGESATPERIEEIRHRWGFDKPLYEQYVIYLNRLIRGDLGTSIQTSASITSEVIPRFMVTFKLALFGTLVAIVIGLGAGILSGVRPYTIVDYLFTSIALLGVSVPIFWSGMLAIMLFSVKLQWLPSSGTGSFKHYILPAVTIGFFTAGVIARQTRSTIIDVLINDYIRTARAKGLRGSTVVLRHALKNAMIPVVTVIGLQLGRMLGGAILTETVFALPGLGRYLVQAIATRDYPVIQAIVLIFAASVVFINLLVDLLYGVLDPRIRVG